VRVANTPEQFVLNYATALESVAHMLSAQADEHGIKRACNSSRVRQFNL